MAALTCISVNRVHPLENWKTVGSYGLCLGFLLLGLAACSRPAPPPAPPAVDRPATSGPPRTRAFREAEAPLRAAVAAAPASTAARGRLAVFLQANDQLAEAAALYAVLRREDPSAGRWPYLLARIRQDEGDLAEASALLAEAASRAPDYPVIGLRRADLHFKSGDQAAAAEFYRAYLVRVPGSAHALLGLARIAIQDQDWRTAETHLLAAIRADPSLGSSHALLVSVYEQLGETRLANATRARAGQARRYREPDDPWLEALADDCYDVEKLGVLADLAAEAGRAERGLALLRRALTIEPSRARTSLALAKALLAMGQRDPALPLLRDAIRNDPGLAEAHYTLIAELHSAGELPAALGAAEAALRANPQNSGLFRQQGLVLQAVGRSAEAEAALRRAITLDPTESQNPEALGNFLWAGKRRDEAATQYERARALSRIAVKPRALLAGYYLEAGRLAEAEACLREATEVDPSLPGLTEVRALFHLRSGNTSLRAGDFVRGEAAYRLALELKPDYEEAWTGLVALWQRSGRSLEARTQLELLLREHPQALFAYGLAARVELQAGHRAAGLSWIDRGLAAARAAGDREREDALRRLRQQAGLP